MNAKLSALVLTLLWIGASQSATAQTATAQLPPGTVLEASVESESDQILFPSSLAGTLQASPCATCAAKVLQLDTATKFNLGGQQVTLQQMAAYCGSVRGKSVTIHYRISDSIVSLVSVLER